MKNETYTLATYTVERGHSKVPGAYRQIWTGGFKKGSQLKWQYRNDEGVWKDAENEKAAILWAKTGIK